MGNIGIKSYMLEANKKMIGRKKLLWDGDNMKITNLEEANQFVSKTYRKGWSLS